MWANKTIVATAAVTTAAAQTPVATKARQEKRAANKKAGDKRENERRRERRAEHQEQWKSDPTCKEFIKLFAHTTGALVTANLVACRAVRPAEPDPTT